MVKLITTAMDLGVGQLQWNVVTTERLKLAQKDPEHYGNIPVRVAGYSQMFNLVPKDLQDHFIARTKPRCEGSDRIAALQKRSFAAKINRALRSTSSIGRATDS